MSKPSLRNTLFALNSLVLSLGDTLLCDALSPLDSRAVVAVAMTNVDGKPLGFIRAINVSVRGGSNHLLPRLHAC